MLKRWTSSSGCFDTITIVMSSANATGVTALGSLSLSRPSYIMLHGRGPSTDPYGTPSVTTYLLGPSSVSYFRIHFCKRLHYSVPPSGVEGVFDIDRVTTKQYSFSPFFHLLPPIAFLALSTTSLMASSVEQPLRNPNWLFDKCLSEYSSILPWMMRSKIVPAVSSMKSGR